MTEDYQMIAKSTTAKVVKAILDLEKWTIHKPPYDRLKIVCDTIDGHPIAFIRGLRAISGQMDGIEMFRDNLKLAVGIAIGNNIVDNPWRSMSDEEILVKCDLDYNINKE